MFKDYPKRSILGPTLMLSQASFHNAVFFTFGLVITNMYGKPSSIVPYFIVTLAIGNLLGPPTIGRLFDVWGRRPMISLTYAISGVGLVVLRWFFATRASVKHRRATQAGTRAVSGYDLAMARRRIYEATGSARGAAATRAPWRRPPTERERRAQRIERSVQPFMAALGIVLLLVVLGQILAAAGTLRTVLTWSAWLLWAVFVFEYALRVVIAPSTWGYLRRTWWQVLLLAVPFLSFLRLVTFVRLGRAARIVSSSIRASRTSAQALRDRLVWLGLVHAIVVLGAAESLLEFGRYSSFATAMHDAAYAATTGEPFSVPSPVGNVLEVVLAMYSVAVFAALAGSIGAFLLDRRRSDPPRRLLAAERPEA